MKKQKTSNFTEKLDYLLREAYYGPIQEILSFVHPFDVYFRLRFVSSKFYYASTFYIQSKMFDLSGEDTKELKNIQRRQGKVVINKNFLNICFEVIQRKKNKNESVRDLLYLNMTSRYYQNFKEILRKEVYKNPIAYEECARELVQNYFFSSDSFKESFSILLLSLFEGSFKRKEVVTDSLLAIIHNILNSDNITNKQVRNRLCVIMSYIKGKNLAINIFIDYNNRINLRRSFYLCKERVYFYLENISSNRKEDVKHIAERAISDVKKFKHLDLLPQISKRHTQKLVDIAISGSYVKSCVYIFKNIKFSVTFRTKIMKHIIKKEAKESDKPFFNRIVRFYMKDLLEDKDMLRFAIKYGSEEIVRYFDIGNPGEFLKSPENIIKFPENAVVCIQKCMESKTKLDWEEVLTNLMYCDLKRQCKVNISKCIQTVFGSGVVNNYEHRDNLFYRYAIKKSDFDLQKVLYPHVKRSIVPIKKIN